MRGDVGVLKRLEKQSRRQDRVQKALRKKLKRPDERAAVYVKRCAYGKGPRSRLAFVSQPLHSTRLCSRYVRRLVRPDKTTGRRSFHAVEVGGGPDCNHGFAVLVAPAEKDATPEAAVQRVLKLDTPVPNLSVSVCPGMPLLHARADADLESMVFASGAHCEGGNEDREEQQQWEGEATRTVSAVPFFPEAGGPPLLFLRLNGRHSVAAASDCGLDESLFCQVQNASLRLLSAIVLE